MRNLFNVLFGWDREERIATLRAGCGPVIAAVLIVALLLIMSHNVYAGEAEADVITEAWQAAMFADGEELDAAIAELKTIELELWGTPDSGDCAAYAGFAYVWALLKQSDSEVASWYVDAIFEDLPTFRNDCALAV